MWSRGSWDSAVRSITLEKYEEKFVDENEIQNVHGW